MAAEVPPAEKAGQKAKLLIEYADPNEKANQKARLLTEDPTRVPKRLTRVPAWLYEEEVTVWWWCGHKEGRRGLCYPRKITKASFVWICNLVAFIAHVGFFSFAFWGATRDGSTMATPQLKVHLTRLTWIPDSNDPLLPVYQEAGGLYLAHMTIWFFLLSAIFHGIVCLGNWRQAFAYDQVTNSPDSAWDKISYWTGWYYVYLHECRNPLRYAALHTRTTALFQLQRLAVAWLLPVRRWIEYSFSASLMVMVFTRAGGITHVYILITFFALMWCTQCFGYFAERLCRPIDMGPDTRPLYWAMNPWNPHRLLFNLDKDKREWNAYYAVACMNRLGPHIAGYVPYVTVWACLLHSFFWNISMAPEGAGPPAFVWAIVIGQAVVFSLFGITQVFLLGRTDGPSWYYGGEVSYQFLSVLAKGLLGSMLVANVLMYENFNEALDAAMGT